MTPELLDRINTQVTAFVFWIVCPMVTVMAVAGATPMWVAVSVPVVGFLGYVTVDALVDAMRRDQGRRRRCESYWEDDEREGHR